MKTVVYNERGEVLENEIIENGRYTRIVGDEVVEERDATPEDIESSKPIPRKVYKLTIWERATDEEAEQMVAMLEQQPVKLRKMWEDSQYLSTDHPLFVKIKAALIDIFGEERAAELLAPSNDT